MPIEELSNTPPPQSGVEPKAPAREPADLKIGAGSFIGHYEIIRPLGKGGMSEVLLARDTRLSRLVAIKVLLHYSGELAARFLAEARATAQLVHENIVVIHELGEHAGQPFMVLEYLKGKTLRQLLKERAEEHAAGARSPSPGLSPGRAVELMIPVVRALACAHERGIVHRDLKPPNIAICDTGVVKVLDFGIAKLLGAPRLPGDDERAAPPPSGGHATDLTRDGALMGTLPYMAPEQLSAGTVDARADVWAAGIVLFELLRGRHPLAPLTATSLLGVRDLDAPMPRVHELLPSVGKLGWIIDRCLIKRKEDRLGSARDLLAELEGLGASAGQPVADEERSPYAGLSAFQESDAGRFFGRARAVSEVSTRLREQSLVAVVGPSGAGKSSFVRAGLIPALQRTGEAWEALVLRPGPHPLAALAELLITRAWQASVRSEAPSGGANDGGGATPEDTPGPRPRASRAPASLPPPGREGLIERLRVEPALLGVLLRARARRRLERILLFVDQFEELYTLADEAERAAFFACLAGVVDDVGSPLRAVVTVRSDFLDRVAEAHAAMIGLNRGLYLLAPLDREGLREALVRPLSALDYRFEHEGLCEEMLETLSHTGGALPLLQFTAAKLWEQRDRQRRVLTEASYRAIGGVAGTLAGHADAVLALMTPGERKLARVLLLYLITPERTREPVRRGELLELGAAKEDLRRVLDRLIDARLLTAESRGDADAMVELVHESLITAWPTLAQWVAEGQKDAAFVARLRSAAREWQASGQDEDRLWRGQAAEDARRWQGLPADELAPGEERFLNAVLELAERSRRQRRRLVVGIVALSTLVAVGMSTLAWNERRANAQAQQEAARARDVTRLAVAREQQEDPTTVIALLREVEGREVPRGWTELAKSALDAGVARTVLRGHSALVSAAFWSPDGKQIVSASGDRTVRVWNADGTGTPLVLRGHESNVNWASWSPDGRRIASASADMTVRVWNADGTGAPLVLRGHEGPVVSAAWSPDGQRIVSASHDRTVRVWNADGTGAPLVLQGHEDIVHDASWSPDGRRIVSASSDRTVRIWSADGTGAPLVLRGHEGGVNSAAWSPDGRRVVSGAADKTLRVWSADGAGPPLVLRGHSGIPYRAVFSPDGQRIASASNDKTVRIWSADGTGTPLVFRGHMGLVFSAAWSPDGKRIVSASLDRTVRIWDADQASAPLVFRGHEEAASSVAWSPDGRRLASASTDRTVRVWNADGTGAPLVLQGHTEIVRSASWSPDGRRLASASHDKTVRVWNADGTGAPLVLQGDSDWVVGVSWSPDGRRLASASFDTTVRVWNADGTGVPLVLDGHTGWVQSVSWSPDGRRLASASADRTVRVWNADGTGPPLVLQGHSDAVYSVSWSPDGRRLASASGDTTVRVWNADGTGAPLVLQADCDLVYSVSWSPDGRRLASASTDKMVRVWSADGTGAPLVLDGHSDRVSSVAWSPDGQRIASASYDRTIRVWRDLVPVEPRDPRLWAATTYCPPVEVRRNLLRVTEESARDDQDRCERRVRAR